jgi:hypothetical protein
MAAFFLSLLPFLKTLSTFKQNSVLRIRKRSQFKLKTQYAINAAVDLREAVCDSVGFILVMQDRNRWRAVVKTVMNLRVP